jgi:hypothetical protein
LHVRCDAIDANKTDGSYAKNVDSGDVIVVDDDEMATMKMPASAHENNVAHFYRLQQKE